MARPPVKVLIDADPLVYRVGFASEHSLWRLEWCDVNPEHRDDPDYDRHYTKFFRYAERLDEFVRLMNLHPEEIVREQDKEPEPLSFALRTMRESIEKVETVLDTFLKFKGLERGETKLFLTGEDQFREKLATILPYKGNRDRSKRPHWYKEIREYLVEHWDAEVCDIIEADDAVAIRQWQEPELDASVICTLDKDLSMVPGLHLNYQKQKAQFIDVNEALLNFYRQLITGDRSDNIPGLHKVGVKGAMDLLPFYMPEDQMYSIVLGAYAENMEKFPDKHGLHTDPAASLLENGRLLWMMDHPDRLWTPPGEPEASLSEWLAALPRENGDA